MTDLEGVALMSQHIADNQFYIPQYVLKNVLPMVNKMPIYIGHKIVGHCHNARIVNDALLVDIHLKGDESADALMKLAETIE